MDWNLDFLLILALILLMGNLWFIVSFVRFSRVVETKLREAVAKKR